MQRKVLAIGGNSPVTLNLLLLIMAGRVVDPTRRTAALPKHREQMAQLFRLAVDVGDDVIQTLNLHYFDRISGVVRRCLLEG